VGKLARLSGVQAVADAAEEWAPTSPILHCGEEGEAATEKTDARVRISGGRMSTMGRSADETWRKARKGYSTEVTVLPALVGVCIQQGDQYIYMSPPEAQRVAKEVWKVARAK
jgi:hypothetical protein